MTQSPFKTERCSFSPVTGVNRVERVLIIRLHATGDVAITLPFCSALKARYPHVRIDFLTHTGIIGLPSALSSIDSVKGLNTGNGRITDVASAVLLASVMRSQEYDVVLDLQRNRISRLVRRTIRPASWGEFDRFGPTSAAQRTRETIERTGFDDLPPLHRLPVREDLLERAKAILLASGWDGTTNLVVVNPAGLWKTRNWPRTHYIELLRNLEKRGDRQFLCVGTDRISAFAKELASEFPTQLIDLSGRTTVDEALALLQWTSAMVSEDSGLLHMAWASGIPTVALFGSSNHVWAGQPGSHIRLFHSGDLECGACMSSECIHGDVRCLSRITPDTVAHTIEVMLHEQPSAVNA